jgi:hypothetical protein
VSTKQTLAVTPGTQEYLLDDDFTDMVSFTDSSNRAVGYINIKDVPTYEGSEPKYYLRNRYIGIVPSPTESTSYYYYYRIKSTAVASLSTYIDLPDNAFYALKDWMMYRACLKFQNPLADTYYTSFTNSVNLYVQSAIKRDSDQDTWDIAGYANA